MVVTDDVVLGTLLDHLKAKITLFDFGSIMGYYKRCQVELKILKCLLKALVPSSFTVQYLLLLILGLSVQFCIHKKRQAFRK